jgi:hypothetical protein
VRGPVPLVPFVIVSQVWLLEAVQAQPEPMARAKLPVLAPETADADEGVSVTAHGSLNWNWFESALAALPPGPSAVTRDS